MIAQLNSFKVEDLCGFDDLFLKLVVERSFFHHFESNGVESFDGPLVEPVECAAVDEGGEVANALTKDRASWAHGQDHVQVLLHLLQEKVEDLFRRAVVVQLDVPLLFRIDPHLFRHQDQVVWSEQARYFVLVDQIVDVFQHEAGLELVVCQEEDALFEVAARLVQQILHVIGPLLICVVFTLLRLLYVLVHKEGGQVAEALAARTSHSNQQGVSLVHLENTADAEQVCDCVVEEHEVHWAP